MYSNSLLEHILTLPGNDKCLECSAPEPKWASFPSATFLCFKCARAHKKFTKPQTIKSLEVADFTNHEISLLSLGGNFRFSSLMNEYSVSLNEPTPEHKYQTIIGTYYCNLLEAEVNKVEKVPDADRKCQLLLAQRPILEVGGELNTDGKYNFENLIDDNSIPQNEDQKAPEKIPDVQNNNQQQQSYGWGIGNFFSLVNNAIHKTAQYAGVDEGLTNMQNKISENMEYYGVNSFVKNTSEKVSGLAKTTGEKVTDLAKTTGEKVTDIAKTTATFIKDKSNDLYENNQYVHNAVDGIGTGYTNIKEKSIQFASGAYNAASSYVNTNLNPQGSQVQQEEPSQDPRSISEQLKDDKI